VCRRRTSAAAAAAAAAPSAHAGNMFTASRYCHSMRCALPCQEAFCIALQQFPCAKLRPTCVVHAI
jgi:hypothetical protein